MTPHPLHPHTHNLLAPPVSLRPREGQRASPHCSWRGEHGVWGRAPPAPLSPWLYSELSPCRLQTREAGSPPLLGHLSFSSPVLEELVLP